MGRMGMVSIPATNIPLTLTAAHRPSTRKNFAPMLGEKIFVAVMVKSPAPARWLVTTGVQLPVASETVVAALIR